MGPNFEVILFLAHATNFYYENEKKIDQKEPLYIYIKIYQISLSWKVVIFNIHGIECQEAINIHLHLTFLSFT